MDSSDLLPLQNERRTYVRRGNVIRLASAFAIANCVAMLGANGWSIYHTRSQEIERVKIANENLVAGVTQRLEASLSEVDHVLNILKFELERVDSTTATLDHLQPLLVNLVAQMSQLKGLLVYSKAGKWIGSSEATWGPLTAGGEAREGETPALSKYILTLVDLLQRELSRLPTGS